MDYWESNAEEQVWLESQDASVWLYRVDVLLNCNDDFSPDNESAFKAMGEVYRLMEEAGYTGIR